MPSRILVLTDNHSDAQNLTELLHRNRSEAFEVEWLRQLGAGVERLRQGGVDAVVVDLSLPDSSGLATFDQLLAAAPHTPS